MSSRITKWLVEWGEPFSCSLLCLLLIERNVAERKILLFIISNAILICYLYTYLLTLFNVKKLQIVM